MWPLSTSTRPAHLVRMQRGERRHDAAAPRVPHQHRPVETRARGSSRAAVRRATRGRTRSRAETRRSRVRRPRRARARARRAAARARRAPRPTRTARAHARTRAACRPSLGHSRTASVPASLLTSLGAGITRSTLGRTASGSDRNSAIRYATSSVAPRRASSSNSEIVDRPITTYTAPTSASAAISGRTWPSDAPAISCRAAFGAVRHRQALRERRHPAGQPAERHVHAGEDQQHVQDQVPDHRRLAPAKSERRVEEADPDAGERRHDDRQREWGERMRAECGCRT